MPEYKLSILVEGAENGASDVLGRLSGGLGALNVAMGNLIADGLKATTGALVEFGRQGLAVATDYQSSLNMFQAVSGATGDQMAAIAAEAKRLGGDMSLPATSAGDAARAMTELAKAGLSVDNALKAGKGTLQLAAAGNLDEAQAAEIAANALNSFGLAGDKAAMVADLFAAAANKSSLEVTDVADGFKMASAVFSAFQGPVVGSEKALKDLTTAMALLGNVGIKGSDAGTSLKQMLLQLTGPSSTAKDAMAGLMYNAMGASGGIAQLDTILGGKAKDRSDALKALAAANPDIAKMGDIAYDSAGKMRPLQDIIRLVTLGTKNLNDEQRNQALTTIFGADATRAIIGLMKAGPEAFAAMEQSIAQQGAAADLAGAQTKGLEGAWKGFKSVLETTQLSVIDPLLGPLEQGVRSVAGALAAATPALVAFTQSAIVPAVQWFAGLLTTFLEAPDKIGFVVGLFKAQATNLAQAVGQWALDAIPGLLLNLLELRNRAVAWAIEQAPAWGAALFSWGEQLWGWVQTGGAKMLGAFTGKQVDLFAIIAGAVPGLVQQLLKWGTAFIDWAPGAFEGLIQKLGPLLDTVGAWIRDVAAPWLGPKLAEWAKAFFEWVGPASAKLTLKLGDMLGELLTWIVARAPTIAKTIGGWIEAAGVWFGQEGVPEFLKAVGTWGVAVIGKIQQLWGDAFAPGSIGEALIKGLQGAWESAKKWIAENWARLWGSTPITPPMPANGMGGGAGDIPHFAAGGTMRRGGLALVGERGPELAMLPGGTGIIPNGATRGLLGGGSGGGTSISVGQIVVNGSGDPARTAHAVREELLKLGKRNLNIFGGYA